MSTHEAFDTINKDELNDRANVDNLFKHLESFGGFFDITTLSNKLGISEEEINNEIIEGKLLSLNYNGADVIPAFQFAAFKKIQYLEDVLIQMPDLNDIDKAWFLTSYIDTLNDNPIHILKKNPDNDIVNIILKKASLFNVK